jgi:transporter family protein
LTNANALVAVALSAWLFKEWKELDMVRVGIGAVLIVIGVTVVSSAKD